MTLLYSAPASPLVQPRNCVLGSTLSASIAIAFKYLSDPEYLQVIPDWMVRVTGERSQPTPRIFLIPRPCGVPLFDLPRHWQAVALAPATSIAAMQICGVTHPPAGAASFIFISAGKKITDLGWVYLLFPLFLGNAISTLCAILFNNLHPNRQYPMYW
eukprot:5655871-Prymnesium_polylepis.1